MGCTRIKGRYVVGFDGQRHRLLENGEVVYRDDTIIFCGFGYDGPVDREIDAGYAIVGPGFIDLDALADLDSTVLGFDNGPAWRCGRVWASSYVERGSREVYDRTAEDFMKRYAYAQLLHNGITTALPITSLLYREWAETYDEFARAVDIAAELGLRTYLGPAYRTGLSTVRPNGRFDMHWDEPRGLTGLDDAIRFLETFDGRHDGLIRGMLAPDRIEGCSLTLLERTRDASRALECPVRLHCCQSQLEVDTMQQRFGTSSLQLLHDTGFLGPRALLPHGLFLGGGEARPEQIERELGYLADAGSTLVHCPIVFGRHGKALNSFSRLRARGINIGLGTDTFPPDLIRNMHAGIMLNRVMEDDSQAVSAADFYNAATLDGARALGREDLGRLAPGARADITVFDLSGFHLGQRVDPIQTMIMNGTGRDFKTVIVNGRIRVDGGAIAGVDYEDWHRHAQTLYDGLKASYPERTHLHPPVEQIFSPSFELLPPGDAQ
ncbi:amidohydrolase family protein [Marinobacterium aestuariivivens]|uniref:Amidohydrolase family protein n=1 Tax=Marinobacterium aestuariivivens TaxID=1698799 RepID=A0ABW2A7X4_9GAMM